VALPAQRTAQAAATQVQSAQVFVAPTPGGIAKVAPVARVAEVARVATVAQVATVATVGGGAGQQSTPRTAAPRLTNGAPGNGESRVGEREPAQDAAAPRTARISAVHGDASALALATVRAAEPGLTNMGESAGTDVSAARSVDMSERVAAILDVHNRSQDRPISSLLLRLEHPELGEDRLRVDLRNNSVGATLDVANARVADQLNAHVADLRRALEAQGLETDHLTIRHAARAAEAAAPIAEREAMRGAPLPPDSNMLGSLGARENVSSARSSSRSSDHQQQTPDQRQQRGRKDPQGGR
jgi:flagellar hook-length control protein FliK